jgi:hypothetical protein
MSNISFFAKVTDGSTYCRGLQISEYLGAKLNPISVYDDDICIFVKKPPPNSFPKYSYYDVVDYPRAGSWLLLHPEIKIIVISKIEKQYYSRVLNRMDLILIPHHHCNYDCEKRDRKEVKTVGTIGNINTFYYDWDIVKSKFEKENINFIYETVCRNRYDVINFYKKIDVQVIWRRKLKEQIHNPLKLSNAGSFGIPTIAWPEKDFIYEWDGDFISVTSIDDMVKEVCKLRNNKDYYNEMSLKSLAKAEEYHIEKISKLYLELK